MNDDCFVFFRYHVAINAITMELVSISFIYVRISILHIYNVNICEGNALINCATTSVKLI